ncbi:MAG TPA: ATP-binding protein [Candidatus Binataceae bacterium]
MGLRTKLAGAFVLLLTGAVLAASMADLDWTLAKMANEVIDSGNVVAAEVFEQVRSALAHTPGDPAASLRGDPGLQAFIESVRAFATGIVFISIEGIDGHNIIGEQVGGVAPTDAPMVDVLARATKQPLPFRLLRALWREHNYMVQRPVLINNRPFAMIRVGVSTALIADEVHQLVWAILGVSFVIIFFAAGTGAAIGDFLSRSVVAITSGVEQLASGREEVNLPVTGHDELGNLADKFNHLSRQVLSERNRWENERGGLFKALRSMTDAIVLIDADTTILFANAEAQTRLVLGANAGEGRPLHKVLGASHPLVRMVEAALASGTEAHDVAIELRDTARQALDCLVSILPLSRGREAAGLLVTLRDLKPVAELETVVEYSSHLARMGGLISGVAHQIRKPLNVLSIRLEWLRQDAEQGMPLAAHIESVRYEIHRLDSVIEGLLRFMRPERLERGPVVIGELLAEAGAQITSSTISVDYQTNGMLPVVNADRALLAEAFRNIFQNAAESMSDGGRIVVQAMCLPEGFVEIVIADSGCGIEPEQLNRIFDLYFTTKPSGNGMGLSLALRAIDLHHGTIAIDSKVGLGTTVRVRLPGQTLSPNLQTQPPAYERL